ncbi:condensation domain-containing protein [Tumidithrix helvetica PCC 7403]|uniref:condensation domain-containing protein n=1 Tax=Tumidithrix helvetica TaxID=3457545 RepID=UPI003CA0870A
MERHLGAFEHSFWLYDQVHPLHFALSAKIRNKFSIDRLRQSLTRVQQLHPLLRVRIELDKSGRPKFVEQNAEIPLRVLLREDDLQWQRELEVEMSKSFDWAIAPLARVVLLQSDICSELIVTCHHSIADGMSVAYLIRDIVQGLESDLPVVRLPMTRELSESFPIESVVPSMDEKLSAPPAGTPQQEALSSGYSTEVSTRPRPHIRTALLSAELTWALNDRCREQKTSVHGAIAAAFLLALAGQKGVTSSQLKCLSPINVRSHLMPTVGEAVGLYITYGLTNHELPFDSTLWEIARSFKSQLSEAMMLHRLFEVIPPRQAAIATLPSAQVMVQGMQQQYGYDLLVTNLGRLNLEQQFGSLQIESLYGPAVMAGMEQERIVGVATLGDRLSLTVSSPAHVTSSLQASSFLAEALQFLSHAVPVSNFALV